MIKWTIHQEVIIRINKYVPSLGAPKYVNQLLKDLKGKTNKNTTEVENLNTQLTTMDISSRNSVRKFWP